MKKILALFAALCVATVTYATNMGDDFYNHYSPSSNLAAYNRDLNSLIGVADFHTGRATNFPAISIGASVGVFKPSEDNDISSDSYTVLPFIIAETKIPVINVGVAVRGTSMSGYRSIGGGLTYQMDILEIVNLSFGAFYDNGRTDYYTSDHYSASAIASTTILALTPYAGVGYDYGKLATRGFGTNNRDTSDGQARAMVGVKIHPFPLFSGFVAYTVTKDNHGFTGGLGLSF